MRIYIHVRPGAKATAVGGEHDGALVVRVAAPAVGGRATEAALAAVAGAFAVPRRSVALLSGATSRRKYVEIAAEPSELASLVAKLSALRIS